jgi:hypothetical protein
MTACVLWPIAEIAPAGRRVLTGVVLSPLGVSPTGGAVVQGGAEVVSAFRRKPALPCGLAASRACAGPKAERHSTL